MTKMEQLVKTFETLAESFNNDAIMYLDEFYQGKAEAYAAAAEMLSERLKETP